MDAFGLLAQGIAQLQTAMSATMAHRAQELEVVKPGISELPRLPELSETSCIDVGDWIHSLECPMGDLSNGSAAWWREILACLDRFYEAYLASSNLAKLALKPESFATAYVKEDKWCRVDKRATSMILAALPEGVKTEVMASRLTGVLPVLGRVMVLYRPGSAAERQQILKALESPGTASTATEVVDQLRRWNRWLRRAGDVGLQCPDASVLLRGLDAITRKALQEHGEIQFRINMMRYTLEVDVKPTQATVKDLHNALLSEFEQVAFRGRVRPTPTPAATIKALSTAATTGSTTSTTAGDQGTESSSPKSRSTPCKFFLTDQGCRKGASCKFSHEVDKKQKQGRCWTCGSKQHVSKQCPTREKQANPRSLTRSTTTKDSGSPSSASLAAIAPESAHPVPPTTTTTSPPSVSGTSSTTPVGAPLSESVGAATRVAGTPPTDDIRELLKEANSMLKEMRQLKVLTVEDINVQARSLGLEPETGRTGLLDSGASHAYRAATEEEIAAADRVRVQLANGDHVTLAQNRAGTLLATASSPEDTTAPIVPLGSLVQDLNCELTWGRRKGLEIVHPVHGTIRPKVVGKCPLIGEAQALQLIKELEDKRVEDLQRSTMAMQRTLWLWNQEATWSKHLHAFLCTGERTSQLMALEAEDSPFHALSSTVKGVMAEDLVLNDKAGWKYLQAIPVSRRRRKLLMSKEWVINLFAGPADGTAEMKVLEDGCVMIEIDILRSKAFDLRKAAGVYRALMWASATGRVKGVMASLPMRSENDEALIGKAMWCALVAKAARGLYEETPAFVMFEGGKFIDYVKGNQEHAEQTGLQVSWKPFVEAMCLDELYGTLVTNLDYDKEKMITSTVMGRWTEDFKNSTVHAVMKWMWSPETRQRTKWMAKMDAGSFLSSLSNKELEQWRVHVKNNHMPYNRKCRTCVEASGTGRRHVKVRTPSAYCMSLDVCGPFRNKGKDPDHSDYRFALIAAYVVPRIHKPEVPDEGGPHKPEVPDEGGPHKPEVPDEGGPHKPEVPDEGGPHKPEVPDEGDSISDVVVPEQGNSVVQIDGGDFEPEVEEDNGTGLGPLQGWVEGDLVEDDPGESQGDDHQMPVGMTEEEYKRVFFEVDGIEGYQVMYMAHPLRSRTTRDVLSAVQDVYLRLRAQGFPVSRVHADRARELRSDPLRQWLLDRGTYVTYTEGQSPQANGRAEAAVKYAKTQTKKLLSVGNFSPKLWPVAMRYAMWAQMQKQMNPEAKLIPFGTKVHVKKKVYGVGGKFDLQSKWGQGYYMGPSADVNDGSVIMMEKGNFITTNHMRPELFDAAREIELEEYQAIISTPARRLRKKSTLDPGDYEGLDVPMAEVERGGEEKGVTYDPNHPAEEFARTVLKEKVILRDYLEALVGLLPQDGKKPKRFGEQSEEEMVWSSGAYVFSGMVGIAANAKIFPRATRVLCEYLKSQCPEAQFNSIAVFKNIKAKKHKDAHNVGQNVAIPLTDFKGTDIIVTRKGVEVTLKVSEGPLYFDPREDHETTPCIEGTSIILVGYSVRDSAKLKDEEVKYLRELGFQWRPHRAGQDPPLGSEALMKKAEVKSGNDSHPKKCDVEPIVTATADIDLAIQDLEERALRLRDLLEEEEIMAEQARRLGETVREELADTRDYVAGYLDEVHKQLMQFQSLKEGAFLRAARLPDQEMEHINYEKMLDELEGDLDVIHTVPLDQVKEVLERWSMAINKEIQSLFDSGTLTKVTQGEARTMERSGGLKIVPSKCVFTLKPPTKPGDKCRRKCRLVICGNYIQKGEAGEQMDLYASGTSTEVLRLALTLAAARQWLAAIADVTSAFLMAEWPSNLPKYGLTPPKVVRDSGHAGQEVMGGTAPFVWPTGEPSDLG